MSSYHSEQMFQRSQVSRMALISSGSQNVFVFVVVIVFVFVFVNLFGHDMSSHHSEQMSQRSQVPSNGLSYVPKSKGQSLTDWVTRSPIELFWTAKKKKGCIYWQDTDTGLGTWLYRIWPALASRCLLLASKQVATQFGEMWWTRTSIDLPNTHGTLKKYTFKKLMWSLFANSQTTWLWELWFLKDGNNCGEGGVSKHHGGGF